MQYIETLREGDMVSETYLCKKKDILKTKAGKSYYSLLLQDKTGTIDAKIWELSNAISHFDIMDYIHIDAQVVSFQNALQLNVKRVRKSQPEEFEASDFVPITKNDIAQMYDTLLQYIHSIQNPALAQLVSSFFIEDQQFIQKFQQHSAAKSVHHGFVGGLLEHTLGVVTVCDFLAKQYPIIERDLLIASALFHDIGKTKELSTFPENDYTEAGQLLGHIFIGTQMVAERIQKIPGFPALLAEELQHCILAHHGELEYGSPKKPAIVEAMALNFADNIDAKLQTMKEILQGAQEKKDWLGYQKLFESNLRRTSLT